MANKQLKKDFVSPKIIIEIYDNIIVTSGESSSESFSKENEINDFWNESKGA